MIIVLILSWITSLINLICLVQIGHNQEDIYQGLKVKHDRNLEELREMKYMVKEIKRSI